jgi:hypothetical protein
MHGYPLAHLIPSTIDLPFFDGTMSYHRLVTKLTYMKSSLITLKISMQIKSQTNLRLSNIFNNNISNNNNNLIFPQDREFKLHGM